MQNLFLFEENKLICERLYFDQLTIMKQLQSTYEPTSTLGIITTVLIHLSPFHLLYLEQLHITNPNLRLAFPTIIFSKNLLCYTPKIVSANKKNKMRRLCLHNQYAFIH